MDDDVVGKVLPAQSLDVVDALEPGELEPNHGFLTQGRQLLPGEALRACYCKLGLFFCRNESYMLSK